MESQAAFEYKNGAMKNLPIPLLLVLGALAFLSSHLQAQSPAAASESDNAYSLFSSGNYVRAAAAYEEMIKGYPTDILVQASMIQLAVCQLYTGQYEKALGNLEKAKSGPPLTADQLMMLASLRPQILAAKASTLPQADRKPAFEEAIKGYADYMEKYPQSAEVESARYGRAICFYQIGEYSKSVEELQANIEKFATSPTVSNSKNLLAITLAAQADKEFKSGDKGKGLGLLKQSEEILRKIIADKSDLALINEANFQLGEILFMQAVFSPESDRASLYLRAADAYRDVRSKEDIEAMQQEKIKALIAQKTDALRGRNIPLKNQLDKDNERAVKKLAEISAKPDQTAPALLKLGEVLFNAGKYNESRTVIRHVSPFLSLDEEKMRAGYFRTMTYAMQNSLPQAVKSYQDFSKDFKAKPIAENLPFLIGNMHLVAGKAQESIRFFDESLQQYPQGPSMGFSLAQKAQAHMVLKKYDEALKTFQSALEKNPALEVAVMAQFGLATVFRETAQWEKAWDAYKKTKEKYPKTPQGIEAAYWIAACMQQLGQNKDAIPLLKEFIQTHSAHALIPLAKFALGNAQIAIGQKDDGTATLAEVATKFPDSAPAPFTYFARAQVFSSNQKPAEVTQLMRDFIARYPKDEKIFFAYNSIAQNAVSAGSPQEAAGAYAEFVKKYPDNPNTPASLLNISELKRSQAERMGINFAALAPEDKTKWNAAIEESVASVETLLAKYPKSAELAAGVQSLLTSQRLLVRSKSNSDEDLEKYFQQLAAKSNDPTAKSLLLFSLGGFISEKDKSRALDQMTAAFQPTVVYMPKDMEIYGLALLAAGKADLAVSVFQKISKDYPNPQGVEPQAAPPLIQEAQAAAFFGMGRVAQVGKKTAEAAKFFNQLKSVYPWSPKILEANYGIAEALIAENKVDEAMKILGGIIRAQNATADLRANSFLLYGYIMKDKASTETDPEKKKEALAAAIDFFMKIPQFYSGVPAPALTGLWEGAQLLEHQAAASSDSKLKAQQLKRAKAAYQQITENFPNDKLVPQAKQRLESLTSS